MNSLSFRGGERGIVLISALILVLVLTMFIGALHQTGLRSMFDTQGSTRAREAESAAKSGLQYALSRLRQDPRWRGDSGGYVLQTPSLTVWEEAGNVIGFLGDQKQFRIRFNYQDGAGGPDLMDDPLHPIENEFVSINNFLSPVPRLVPRADQGGYSVTADSRTPYPTPSFSACLIVEGRAGSGLQGADLSNQTPDNDYSSATVEGIYRIDDIASLSLDAASMSASNFRALLPSDTGQVEVASRNGDKIPRLRSKQSVTVENGGSDNYVSANGQVQSGDGALNARSTDVQVGVEGSSDSFYDLAWDEVDHADPSGDTVPAGTYVWWEDGSLHYYDMNYTDYVSFIRADPNHPGVTPLPSFPAGLTVDASTKKMTLTGDVAVVSPDATSPRVDSTLDLPEDFTVIPRLGAAEDPDDQSTAPVADNTQAALYFAGDMELFRQFCLATYGPNYNWNVDGGSVDFVYSNADDPASFSVTLGSGGNDNLRDPMGNGTSNTSTYELIESIFYYDSTLLDLSTDYLEQTGTGTTGGALNLNGVSDNLSPRDLEVSFEPAGEGATLSAPGDIRIGARLEGEGGSITSGGDLRVIGAGADFAARPDASSGVNLYASGDIVLSTYSKRQSEAEGSFQDVSLKGVVYTWGDFEAKVGHQGVSGWGVLNIEGALIAYGGDPGGGIPGSAGTGAVTITAAGVNLTFDPAYVMSLLSTPPAHPKLNSVLWNRI